MFVAVGLVLVAAMTAALSSLTLASHRAAEDAFDYEIAKLAAESGVAFMHAKIIADYAYLEDLAVQQEGRATSPTKTPLREKFDDNGLFDLGGSTKTIDLLDVNRTLEGIAPIRDMGRGKFQVMSVAKDTPTQWTTLVVGSGTAHDYRLGVTIGPTIVDIPNSLTLSGNGDDSDDILEIESNAIVSNYTPVGGAVPSLNSPGWAAGFLNGSAELEGSARFDGDLSTTGSIDGDSRVTGSTTEGTAANPISNVDDLILDYIDRTSTTNDNATLAAVFGARWNAIASADNYGDLYVDSGTHVIPAGTYKVRRFEVSDGATVTFDTSAGPVVFIYIGDPGGSSHRNDLIVTNRASVLVDPGGSTNGVKLLMGPDTDLRVTDQGTLGLNLDSADSSGAVQIIGWSQGSPAGEIEIDDDSRLFARAHTTGHDWEIEDGSSWYGSGFARTLEAEGTSRGGGTVIGLDESTLGTTFEDHTKPIIHAVWDAN